MAICLSHLILLSSKARNTFKLGVSDWFLARKNMIFSDKKIRHCSGTINSSSFQQNDTVSV